MYFDCLHLKVVGNKGGYLIFVYRIFNCISPKLRTLLVCIYFLRCWNESRMVFVYRIFNSIISPKLRTLVVFISFFALLESKAGIERLALNLLIFDLFQPYALLLKIPKTDEKIAVTSTMHFSYQNAKKG